MANTQQLEDLALMGEQRTKINGNTDTLESVTKKVCASAYLRNGTVTCTDANEWYSLSGILTRKETEGFVTNGHIELSYPEDLVLYIQYDVSTKVDKNGAILTFAVRRNLDNADIVDGSDFPRQFDIDKLGSLGLNTTELILQAQKLDLVVKSSVANTVLTELALNTYVKNNYVLD